MEDINNTLKRSWDIEFNEDLPRRNTISPDDIKALNIVQNLLKMENRRYELKITWK